MKKKLISKSAFFNPRLLIGLAFCLIGLVVVLLAFALYPGGKALAQKPEQNQSSLHVAVSAAAALNPQPANVSQGGFYPPLPAAPDQASPTPTPCVNYNYTVSLGAIVPGTTDTGNHADDASTVIALPFSYTLYDGVFSSVAVGSNGHLTFGAVNDGFSASCIPQVTTTYSIFPYRTDLCTLNVAGCSTNVGTSYGIFTSISGTAPNRIFNIEWRAAYYNSADQTVNFEVRLYEGQTVFDVVYGTITVKSAPNDGPLSVGVQKNNASTLYTLVGCDSTGGQFPPVSTGQLYHYTFGTSCASPTPSPTPTSTIPPTPTPSPSPTASSCTWGLVAPYPLPILDEAVVSLGGNLYSFGGVSNGALVANAYRFDTFSWAAITSLPAALEYPAAVTNGTNIYVLGGADTLGNSTTGLYRYNVGLNNYTTLAPFTTGTWNQAAVYLSGKIYKFGGTLTSTASTNVLEIYDIGLNTWTTGAVYPANVSFATAWAQGGFVYAAGGLDAGTSIESNKTYRYDPVGNSWNDLAIADLPATRWGSSSGLYSCCTTTGVIMAGGYSSNVIVNSALIYNPGTDSWGVLNPMVGDRARMNGGTIGCNFYSVGGRSTAVGGFTGTAENQLFNCPCGTPSPSPTLTPTPTATATATATPTATFTPAPPTATPTPGCANYVITNSSDTIVPGTTDIGNHVDDGATLITLPFPVTLYGNTYTTANAGSNGFLSFGSFINSFYSGCLPNASFTFTIFPFEIDQVTSPAGKGIFTLTTGTSPNRTFYIEWRACRYATATTCLANSDNNYEIVFNENAPGGFSIIYGTFGPANTIAGSGAIGVQGTDITQYTQSQCGNGPPAATKQIYTQCVFGTPTPSPTPTSTATATPTVPPTPTPSPSACANYTYSISTGAIVPGTLDTGNHVDDGSTVIALPFNYQLYEQTFSNVAVGSNGHLTFGTVNDGFSASCIPQATTTFAIFPYRTDQCTNTCNANTGTTYGIFTSTSGTAPNRIFNVEWRTSYYNGNDTTVNYEVRLFEGQTAFDVVYGTMNALSVANDGPLSVGVQRDNVTQYTLVGCDPTGGQAPPVSTGQLYHYTLGGCNPTPTPTPTPATINISGNILLCNATTGAPMQNVTLTMTGSNSGTTLTDIAGNYTLSGVTNSGTTTVTPTKPQRAQGTAGINTTDAVAIQRHFLILGTPLSGCHLTAADVNGTGTVNTVDAVAVQRFFLIQGTGTANVGKYVFSPLTRVYAMPLGGDQTAQNYSAVCLGDVVAGFVPGNPRPELPPGEEPTIASTVASVALPDITFDQSKSSFIGAVKASAIDPNSKLVGFQGDLTFDERVVTFGQEPVRNAGLTAGNWMVSGNVLPGPGPIRTLRISAFSTNFAPLSGSGTLFELRMTRVSKAGHGAQLTWATGPDQFIFIDSDLKTQTVGNAAPGDPVKN